MKWLILALYIIINLLQSFSQEMVRSSHIVNGKNYTVFHDYFLFDKESLPYDCRVTHKAQGHASHMVDYHAELAMEQHLAPDGTFTWTHYLSLHDKNITGSRESGYNVDFKGNCTKHIKAILINGEKHPIENKDLIKFSQHLNLEVGINNIDVNVILDDGSILSGEHLLINLPQENMVKDTINK